MNYKTLDDVKRVISLEKPEAVISAFWQSYQEGLQYAQWLDDRKAEYDILWPETEEVPLVDENGDPVLLDDGTQATETNEIDYSDDPNWVSFDDWMQEREILTGTREVTQSDGTTVTETYEYEGDLLRQFVPDVITNNVSDLPEYHKMLRKKRDKDIASLTVTTSTGNTFDADEISRQRMADSIIASSTTGITETNWKLADNSIVLVTLDELKEAHALAIQELGNMVLS